MISHRRAAARTAAGGSQTASSAAAQDESPVGRLGVVLITAAFVLLQATNATTMTIMTVYVTETLRIDVIWAGIALGVAAALEVPALLLIARLSNHFSHLGLLATSCLAGIAYYLGLTFVTEPILLIMLQLLNAWSFAGIAGVGLPLFQLMIPLLGLSTGLYTNTRRLGSIVSGPIIAIGSLSVLGLRGIFLTCAVITLIGLAIITIVSRTTRHPKRPETLYPAEPHRGQEPGIIVVTAEDDLPSRWTAATVYDDMWVDPDDDPRHVRSSPVGERETLIQYLHAYRLTLKMKCDGLTPEQLARRSVPPSTLSLLGLVRHLAEVERSWTFLAE